MSLSVEIAKPQDAVRIVELIREAMGKDLARYVIYGEEGVTPFILAQLEAEPLGVETRYLVARYEGRIVGLADFRVFPDQLFLSYIAVDPAIRGQGIGQKLLKGAAKLLRGPTHRLMTLDVFEHNEGARRWYDRIGFQSLSISDWKIFHLPDALVDGYSTLSNWAQAELIQQQFGFSQFTVTTEQQAHQIGRIGNDIYRVTNRSWRDDPVLISTLKRLSPERDLLEIAVRDTTNEPKLKYELVLTSIRMELELDALLKVLK